MEIAFKLVAVIRQKLFRGPVTHAGLEVEAGDYGSSHYTHYLETLL